MQSYLACAWRGDLGDHLKATFLVQAPTKDRYYIGILNARESTLKVRGRLGILNPGGEQLPLAEVGMSTVFLWTGAAFCGSAALIALSLITVWRQFLNCMHCLMVGVIAVKGCCLLLQWLDKLQIESSGVENDVTSTSWQLVDKAQNVMELIMFLLIALGWTFLGNRLDATMVRFATGVVIISMLLGVCEVTCDTATSCSGYQLSRYILHSLCCLVVIVAMNFNLQKIQTMLLEAPASREVGKTYIKLVAYRAFRWVFLAFIAAPTVELFIKVSVLPWDAGWFYVLLTQIRTFAIYACICYYFRPNARALRVFDVTHDAVDSDDDG
eukprot:TRINITY_DN35698_c0_g2_i2.p1 TRINITY_DN35698_c0_g2~~TRINITY_DN35698_c0_g2_i2.p1  ORF type:complete len:326 (-),score=72.90 TRINITY_DN35698_c0_g2_i2:149-1126(-)